MTYLRVDSSIRRDGSMTREITDTVERCWRAADANAEIVHRDLALSFDRTDPAVPTDLAAAWRHAADADLVPDKQPGPTKRAALAVAAELADEVADADAITIGAPMYNFGIPTSVKAWIDLLITDPRFDPRVVPDGRALAGVPVVVVVAQGGGYGPGTPREGWDHATPYLHRILGDLFGAELTVIVVELAAAEAYAAMEALRPLAARSRAEALASAADVATRQAARSRAA